MIDIKAIRRRADKYNQLHAKYPILPDEMIALCDEVERLGKDAARYQWLRSEHERFDPVCHLSWKQNGDRRGSEWVNTTNLDRDIDAAMEAKT